MMSMQKLLKLSSTSIATTTEYAFPTQIEQILFSVQSLALTLWPNGRPLTAGIWYCAVARSTTATKRKYLVISTFT